ncbi:23257_t:CDS:1, partial [Cetraspora pellucida]
MSINNDTLTIIAFSTLNIQNLKNIKKIHIDTTYKTTKGHFELYRIIGEYQGTGFALDYLILDIIRINGELELSKSEILTQFLLKFQILGLSPDFIFTDKDFTLINAIKNVWPNKGIQLCLWHLKKAILTKMKSNKQQ